MRASEKLRKRIILHDRLTVVDAQLAITLGGQPSNRTAATVRGLLNYRAGICEEMRKVGFQPWKMPADLAETKVATNG